MSYPAAEAAWALAVRHDAQVVETIIGHLNENIGNLWLTAAAECGSLDLLDGLTSLVKQDEDESDPRVIALHEAIDSCSAQD